MKRTFLNASLIAGSFMLLSACGNGEKSADRTEEIYEKHVSQEEMNEQQHEKIVETDQQVAQFDQAAPELQSQVKTLLNDYLSIKNALVESSAAEVQTASGEMLGKIRNFNSGELPDEQENFYNSRVENMREDLRFMAQNNDLEKQRDHFARVTSNTYGLAKAVNVEQPLYYQYCPMAFNNQGGYWLSAQEEIRNPYFGDKMLKCGRIEETIQN